MQWNKTSIFPTIQSIPPSFLLGQFLEWLLFYLFTREYLLLFRVDFVKSSETLENECYQKYEKSGKSFYLSQMASVSRWLSAATHDELKKRIGSTTSISSEAIKPEESCSFTPSSLLISPIKSVHEEKGSGSIELSSHAPPDTLPPPILSFSEFINRRKVTDNEVLTSKRQSKDGVGQGMEKKAKC